MSTKPTTTAQDIETPAPTFTTRSAPQTFDPFNTNPTPEMFEDKWQASE